MGMQQTQFPLAKQAQLLNTCIQENDCMYVFYFFSHFTQSVFVFGFIMKDAWCVFLVSWFGVVWLIHNKAMSFLFGESVFLLCTIFFCYKKSFEFKYGDHIQARFRGSVAWEQANIS